MRIEEARWLEARYRELLDAACEAPVALNLGCGTRKSREVSKPYIQSMTIAPLTALGYRVVHSDLMQADGVELQGDIFDPAFQLRLATLQPRIVLFCNVLEHLPVKLRDQVPEIFNRILAPGGRAFITVPHSYPYHADPLDTMYRPSPKEVARSFSSFELEAAEVIDSQSYGDEFFAASPGRRIRKVLRLLFPFVRPKRWLSHAHRFMWLTKPYRHTCVVLRKPL
jgi:SAM-dependent methyltransferase